MMREIDGVSIPLESGHIVIAIGRVDEAKIALAGFNPLRIGSYCNIVGYLDWLDTL